LARDGRSRRDRECESFRRDGRRREEWGWSSRQNWSDGSLRRSILKLSWRRDDWSDGGRRLSSSSGRKERNWRRIGFLEWSTSYWQILSAYKIRDTMRRDQNTVTSSASHRRISSLKQSFESNFLQTQFENPFCAEAVSAQQYDFLLQ